MNAIHRRWGVEINEDQEWDRLINRLVVVVGASPNADDGSERLLAFRMGRKVDQISCKDRYQTNCTIKFESLLRGSRNPFELAEILEAVIDCIPNVREKAAVIVALVNKSNCGVRLKETKSGVLSYPSGEKILDKKLVEEPLSFLGGESLKEFKSAINHYSNSRWEECSEKIRRSIEEYLREKLDSRKGLESMIKELGTRLKNLPEFPSHLRTTVVNNLKTLDANFNESSKHNSKTYGGSECEYLMYQAGILMNLIENTEI